MTAPIRLDMTADQLAGMKEDLIATLTPAHIEELCTLRADAKMSAQTFSEASPFNPRSAPSAAPPCASTSAPGSTTSLMPSIPRPATFPTFWRMPNE